MIRWWIGRVMQAKEQLMQRLQVGCLGVQERRPLRLELIGPRRWNEVWVQQGLDDEGFGKSWSRTRSLMHVWNSKCHSMVASLQRNRLSLPPSSHTFLLSSLRLNRADLCTSWGITRRFLYLVISNTAASLRVSGLLDRGRNAILWGLYVAYGKAHGGEEPKHPPSNHGVRVRLGNRFGFAIPGQIVSGVQPLRHSFVNILESVSKGKDFLKQKHNTIIKSKKSIPITRQCSD